MGTSTVPLQGAARKLPTATNVVQRGTQPAAASEPQLVDERRAGEMLGLSYWTIREYVAAGLIPTVTPPSPLNHHRKLRRKLIDVADLRAFIAAHKTGGAR